MDETHEQKLARLHALETEALQGGGPDRIEKHSEFPNAPSVFRGPLIKEGRSVQVVKGQNFDAAHPVVKAFPGMFGEVGLVHPPIEQPITIG